MSASSTSVQHALSIKELLSRIFSYSTAKGNASNALVCRAWSNEALSIIWSTVDILHLIRLLAPLENRYSWRFSRDLHAEDWSRFDLYAWRVRVLNIDPASKYDD
ncbi:hypothetical protein AB1N83_012904, partial [Pleurotus pulmonarius]